MGMPHNLLGGGEDGADQDFKCKVPQKSGLEWSRLQSTKHLNIVQSNNCYCEHT